MFIKVIKETIKNEVLIFQSLSLSQLWIWSQEKDQNIGTLFLIVSVAAFISASDSFSDLTIFKIKKSE